MAVDRRALDRFGGARGLRFRAAGAFRLERASFGEGPERWWLVTPEGHAFLGFGVNHVAPALLQRVENRSFWLGVFELPPDAPPEAWLPHVRKKVRADLDAFGFNHLGQHSPAEHFERGFAPYVQTMRFVDICHWQTPSAADFRDVFARDFERHCRQVARQIAGPRRDDPYLIGYAFTDCPILTEAEAAARGVQVYGAPRGATPTWPRVLRNLGPQAPGKQAYVALMRERYAGDVDAFDAVYGTPFASFDALATTPDWRREVDPQNAMEREDNDAFLARILERYYSIAVDALRRYDPRHLIFGDTLNGNTDMPDFAVQVAAQHADLTLYQWYGLYAEQAPRLDRWSALTGKPLFNGDSCADSPAGRRRGQQETAVRRQDCRDSRPAGYRGRTAHHREVPRITEYPAGQSAQIDLTTTGVTMNLNITGHHVEVTPAIRDYVTSKLDRVIRHFDNVTSVAVILSVEKLKQKAEVTLHVRGKDLFVESDDADLYAAGMTSHASVNVMLAGPSHGSITLEWNR